MFARAAGAVAMACVVLGAGGCTGRATPAAAPASASALPNATASPKATASPTPSVDWSALQARAKAATIAPKGLVGIGVPTPPKEDKPVTYLTTNACGKRIDADRDSVHVGYNRVWSAQGWWVSNTVYAYATAAGVDAVGQVQAAVQSCKTYTAPSDGEYTLLGAVALPRYPGVEASYGYCQNTKRADTGGLYVSCRAFLAKGNLVSVVWLIHGVAQQTNSDGLKLVGAVAAEALGKATVR